MPVIIDWVWASALWPDAVTESSASLSIADAPPNPWGATGLEWQTTSPPPTANFEVTPVVTQDAYTYSPEEVVHVG